MTASSPKEKTKVKILVMGRHFLYLPAYFAEFDLPEKGKAPFFGEIPPEYSVRIALPEAGNLRSDTGVFQCLMNPRLDGEDVMFAICDPTVLLGKDGKGALLAASLISSSAFWAVNHEARDVRVLSDLSVFDRIVCYGDNTTSNLIARRIVKRDLAKLMIVKSTEEINALTQMGEGTLAISPELLEIANLINGPVQPGRRKYEIVHELSTSKEFSNVLTTALLTRTDVLERHPNLVRGVLVALQRSLIAIYAGNELVTECAVRTYRDAFHVGEALEMARAGNVFPETIQVRPDRWQRACEFHFISHAIAEGHERKTLTKAEQIRTHDVYERVVGDRTLKRVVNDAIMAGYSDAYDGATRRAAVLSELLTRWKVLGGLALLLGGFVFGQALASQDGKEARMITVLSWCAALACGHFSAAFFKYKKRDLPHGLHWVLFLASWYALHERLSSRYLHDSHFVSGIAMDESAADVFLNVLLVVGAGWVIAQGFYMKNRADVESAAIGEVKA